MNNNNNNNNNENPIYQFYLPVELFKNVLNNEIASINDIEDGTLQEASAFSSRFFLVQSPQDCQEINDYCEDLEDKGLSYEIASQESANTGFLVIVTAFESLDDIAT